MNGGLGTRLGRHVVRPPAFLAVAAAMLFCAGLLGMSIGTTKLDWDVILQVIASHVTSFDGTFATTEDFIVWSVRLPRVLVGMLSGGALAVAGAALQGIFRNPLAGPGVIGTSAGATCGAVLVLITGVAPRSPLWLPLAAFLGAFLALSVAYGIATTGGRTPVTTLILAGIACSAFFSAMTSLMISLRFHEWQVAAEVMFWMMGGLDNRSWAHVWIALPFVAVGALLVFVYSRELDMVAMGEEAARTLGANTESTTRIVLIGAAMLTAASVAVSGILAFVGLVVPHMVRLVVGPAHRNLLPASLLAGACFLVACDVIARSAFAPTELRLGVVTAAFGAPFFIWLLMTRRRQSEGS